MKILLVGHEYPPNVTSGPGRYAGNLVKELINRGHEVTVITSRINNLGERYEKQYDGKAQIYRLDIYQSKVADKIIPDLINKRLLFNLVVKRFLKSKKINLDDYDLMHVLDEYVCYFLDKNIKK